MEIKCPDCGHIVKVADNAAPDLMLKCSGCSNVNMLKSYQAVTPSQEKKARLPRLVEVAGAKEYPLTAGKSLVGRRRDGSTADLQLETSNKYVSRNQFYIEVLELNGRYKTCISHYDQAPNGTKVGDDQLLKDDVMVLKDGDVINICGYELRYEI